MEGGVTVAKPITATPPVKGKAAENIQREILRGTPDTTERRETIRRADEVYRHASRRTNDNQQR
jgi:hypothetical protein